MSDVDPYRYGGPEPERTARYSAPTGRDILAATWGLLREDRSMIWLGLLGNLSAIVGFGALFAPGYFVTKALGQTTQTSAIVGAVLGVLVASICAIFFQAALVIAANRRADGGVPTIGSVLAEAWTLRWKIVGWALLTTTVGFAIRALEQRLGILGKVVGFLGAIAWAVASFFVVPVLVAERLGPIEAVKHSARVIRRTWGTSVRTTLRFGFAQTLLTLVPMAMIIFGAVFLWNPTGQPGYAAFGAVCLVVGVVGLFALSAIFGAVSVYSRALIYRWAMSRPVPGIDPRLFDGAFVDKRRRRRR